MWGEPMPKWRKAQKRHQCQGDGCAKVIARGERYLDRTLRDPVHSHLRYCAACAEPVMESANGYHFFNGRNDFPDRYADRISSAQWKRQKRQVIEQRGNRCERCRQESAPLELHHVHYRSMGSEQPEDVELLCRECHSKADEARLAKSRPKRDDPEEGLIVGPDGDYWGKFDPDTIYLVLQDGRYVPVPFKRKEKS
jgi:hypothetical protein